MSAGTPIQANNKVQSAINLPGKDKNPASELQGIPFEAMFSNALNNGKPTAQLNAIEAQLRDSLFKDEKKPSKYDSEPALNTEAAQSALWAQRDWMQQSGSNMAINSTKPTQPQGAAQPQPIQSQPAKAKAENNTPEETTTASSENKADETAEADRTANVESRNAQSAATSPVQQGQPNQTSSSTAAAPTAGLAAQNMATPEPTTQATQTLPAATTPTATNATIEQTAGAATNNDVKAKPDSVAFEQTQTAMSTDEPAAGKKPAAAGLQVKMDASASTAATRPELATTASNATNANSNIAAQLAPQIAPQIAKQQFSLKGEEFTGLKAGDKIMTTGAAAAGQTNATTLPASLNGLGNGISANSQALIKTPVNQPGFAKEVGQTVQWALGKNMSTVDIRVNPETFGPMNMRLIQKGQQVQLIIRTQDESSANLLAQALGGLKEVLGQNGLQLNQVQIQHGQAPQNNQQAGDTAQQQFAQQQQGGQRGGNGSGKQGEEPDSIVNVNAPTIKRADGKLDLFA